MSIHNLKKFDDLNFKKLNYLTHSVICFNVIQKVLFENKVMFWIIEQVNNTVISIDKKIALN
jgi:hypothetical protein